MAVVGSDQRSDSGGSIVVDGNTSIVLRQIKEVGLCAQTIWDWHIIPSTNGYNRSKDLFNLKAFQVLMKEVGCECRVAILEENLCQAHFTRALSDVFAVSTQQSISRLWPVYSIIDRLLVIAVERAAAARAVGGGAGDQPAVEPRRKLQ